jgi:pimeloyl-ACP methyl ester carboxylesterase
VLLRALAVAALSIDLFASNVHGEDMSQTKVISGKASLAVFTAGQGQPIVFLHAGVADSRMWRAQMESFSKTHRTIAYDRRGYGETTYEAEDYDVLADLAAVLDATAKDTPVVLVGCSLGGLVSSDFAIKYPSRVKALVLVGSAISGQPESSSDIYNEQTKTLIAAMEAADKAKDLDRMNALEAHAWLDGPSSPEGRVTGTARELFLEMNGRALRAPPRGKNTHEGKTYQRMAELKMPILFIIGELDFPDINQASTHLATIAPSAQLVQMNAAHLPSLEQPDAFNAVLADFLKAKGL